MNRPYFTLFARIFFWTTLAIGACVAIAGCDENDYPGAPEASAAPHNEQGGRTIGGHK